MVSHSEKSTLFKRLTGWWRARQRQTDIHILWPACLEQAKSEDQAIAVFLVHALMDSAWDGIPVSDIVTTLKGEIT